MLYQYRGSLLLLLTSGFWRLSLSAACVAHLFPVRIVSFLPSRPSQFWLLLINTCYSHHGFSGFMALPDKLSRTLCSVHACLSVVSKCFCCRLHQGQQHKFINFVEFCHNETFFSMSWVRRGPGSERPSRGLGLDQFTFCAALVSFPVALPHCPSPFRSLM